MEHNEHEIEDDSMWWHYHKQEEEKRQVLTHLLDLWWLAGLMENPRRAKQRVIRYAENEGLLNEFKQSIAN